MQIYLESLGCARNQVDSEIMLARLLAAGLTAADDPAAADIIVVNTCSFIEAAADESIDTILALSRFKLNGRCRRLIVSGCLPERYRSDTAKALPEVDYFLGTGAYDQIVNAALGCLGRGSCLLYDPDAIDVSTPVERKPLTAYSAYLKIAEGCSRQCTYCIIPKLRGRHKSRPLRTILDEARMLVKAGARELNLVAQETTAYGRDLEKPSSLAALLQNLAEAHPSVWIRFLYGHPQSLTKDVWETVARYSNLCPYFDIPIQHASTGVLKRMGRRYRAEDLLELFQNIRAAVPDAALRTTVLVGFPGESATDFDTLIHFVQQVRFDHLGVFAYSDAEDLAAHRLSGPVAPDLTQERLQSLMARQQMISAGNLKRHLGKEMAVIVENRVEAGLYSGRSIRQAPEVDGCTLIRTDRVLEGGKFVKVRIVDTSDHDLIGAMI